MKWDRLARKQGGAIRRDQLQALGVSRRRIDYLVRTRVLVPTSYAGVYRAAGAPDTAELRAWFAVLAGKCALSYLSAGAWWDLPVTSDGRVHITRNERQRMRSHPGVRVHRTLLLPSAQTQRWGMLVTTRTATLLDCLGWLSIDEARSLFDRALQQKWLGAEDIRRRLDEEAGRWGNRQLERLLRENRPGAESHAERVMHRLLHGAGITGWKPNYWITLATGRCRVDIAFPGHRLVVEIDGWRYHRSKEKRNEDKKRDVLLGGVGWHVIRFDWDDVRDEPDLVIARLRAVLAQRPLY